MESFEQFGAARVESRIGESFSRSVGNYGHLKFNTANTAYDGSVFHVEWENNNGETETLYEGESYLDAHRVAGYAQECITKEFERNNVLPKITAYVESLGASPQPQLTAEDFAEDNLDRAKERGVEVEGEGAAAYR